MNRPEIEAMFFRWDSLFPAARPQTVAERNVRIEEWLDSDLAGVEHAVAREAFRDWKLHRNWPPSLAEFREQVAATRRRLTPALPMRVDEDEPPVSPERGLEHLATFRQETAMLAGKFTLRDEPDG